ncbi:MAG: M20/M25/M40 family metallo-hydrolase [Patescibacteria group bacterium]
MEEKSKLLNKFKKNLSQLIKCESVSTDSSFKSGIDKTAKVLVDMFKENGFETKVLLGKTTNPYIFAEYKVSDDKETVLIYGHYDVMPSGDEANWKSKPFELTERSGRLFGRGSVDNKGQLLVHLTAISELIKNKKINCNVKFLVEGNEETGNVEISNVIKKNKKLLACDYVLISDGELCGNRPTIEAGFRGGGNIKITYTTAERDVHSGLYGGAIPNPAHELSILVSKFYDKNNKVRIPGFYEGVEKISPEELKNNKRLKFSLTKLKELTGVKSFKTEKGVDYFSQIGLRPMLTVSGFKSGYTDEGFNNIVPCSAEARVNFRLVSSQSPKVIIGKFLKFVKKNTPAYVKYTVEVDNTFSAVKLDIKSKLVTEFKEILESVYKDKVVFVFVGGSVPVVNFFKDLLSVEVVSIPFGNEDCNMHGINENFDIRFVEKALEFSRSIFSK